MHACITQSHHNTHGTYVHDCAGMVAGWTALGSTGSTRLVSAERMADLACSRAGMGLLQHYARLSPHACTQTSHVYLTHHVARTLRGALEPVCRL